MSERSAFKSRVTTVRGRARAKLAALRKDRLARKRATFGVEGASGAGAGLLDIAASEAARGSSLPRAPAEIAADGRELDVLRSGQDVTEPEVEARDVVAPATPRAPDPSVTPGTALIGEEVAEAAGPSSPPDRTGALAADVASCPPDDVSKPPDTALSEQAETAATGLGTAPPGDADALDERIDGCAAGADAGISDLAETEPGGGRTGVSAADGFQAGIEPCREEPSFGEDAATGCGKGSAPDASEPRAGRATHAAHGFRSARASGASEDTASEGCGGSDLYEIPGIGPGLVWMLHSAGIDSLGDLARADSRELAKRLGMISRLLDLDYLVTHARSRIPTESSGSPRSNDLQFGA